MFTRPRTALFAGSLFALGVAGPAAGDRALADENDGIPDPSIATLLPSNGDPGGVRASLAKRGVTFGVNYTGEFFDVTSGGLSRGSSYNGLLEGVLDVDFEKMSGWKGLTFHTNVFYIHGEGATSNIGALFPVSSIEALESFRLDEIWFEQSFANDAVKLRFGSLAADTEFFLSDTAGNFINGTFGWAGILALDMTQGGPAYPLASMGVRAEFSPNDNVKVLAAIFNASPANPDADDAQRDNRHGTSFRFGDGILAILEGQLKYEAGLPGTVKVGGWRQFNDDYADLLTDARVDGSYGIYGIVDQQIWKGGEAQGISVFARVSGSPERQNVMDFYFDTGIVFSGLVSCRPSDAFGVAFGYGSISDRLRERQELDGLSVISDYEAVLEANYTAEIASGITVKPEFQYFWNPGGRVEDPDRPGRPVEDAVVVGARTTVRY